MTMRKAQLEAGAANGLRLAGLHLQRVSQGKVPVEYGPLRASAYTRAAGSGFNTVVEVGYTAAYALAVHEKVDMKLKGQPRPSGIGDFWDPAGQAKFLEEPTRTEIRTMSQIIAKTARLKL